MGIKDGGRSHSRYGSASAWKQRQPCETPNEAGAASRGDDPDDIVEVLSQQRIETVMAARQAWGICRTKVPMDEKAPVAEGGIDRRGT